VSGGGSRNEQVSADKAPVEL